MKGIFKTYYQHVGDDLAIAHDASPWLTDNNATLASIAPHNVTTGLTLTPPAGIVAGNEFAVNVGAAAPGTYSFELWITSASPDSQRDVLEFQFIVDDPA